MDTKLLTPEEFEQEMIKLCDRLSHDPEAVHIQIDELMTDTLRLLGYTKGIEVLDSVEMWYV